MNERLARRLREKYPGAPPPFVTGRLERELAQTGGEAPRLLAEALGALQELECPFYLLGESAASLTAWLLGLSSSNPLPPHYYCPDCGRVEPADGVSDGFDLPDRPCACGGRMSGDGHGFDPGYLYGGGRRSILLACVPEGRYREVVARLSALPGLAGEVVEPFPPDNYACFRAISIVSTQALPERRAGWAALPPASRVRRRALELCKTAPPWQRDARASALLAACGRVDSFEGALRCYGLAAAAWKEGARPEARLARCRLPDAAVLREDIYDHFAGLGYPEEYALRQMRLLSFGRGEPLFCPTPEKLDFFSRCALYAHIPSRAEAVEYYVAMAKLAPGGEDDA